MNEKKVAVQHTGEWVIVGKIYKMLIPNKCIINKGEGDDTEFLDIRNEKGDAVISCELGVDDRPTTPKNTDTLNETYEHVEILKTLSDVNIWIAYRKTSATFRNIEGKVYTEQKNEFEELLRFSCSDTQLDNVQQILISLQSI